MGALHYFDGQWVGQEKLLISALDLSVARGFGAFDFMRTYQGEPFRLQAHIDRFYRSADFLELQVPVSKDELVQIVKKGIADNGLPETGIRFTLTGGVASDPGMITPGKPSLIIMFKPITSPDPKFYTNGAKVITSPHIRHLPEAKSLSYLMAVIAHREVRKLGAVEAIYMDKATTQIYEGTIANFFVIKNGVVVTPKDGILKGITRQVVLELCQQLDIPCREEPLFGRDIAQFDEAFITGTTKEVMPIVQFDAQHIGNGKVGPITQKLVDAFERLVGKK